MNSAMRTTNSLFPRSLWTPCSRAGEGRVSILAVLGVFSFGLHGAGAETPGELRVAPGPVGNAVIEDSDDEPSAVGIDASAPHDHAGHVDRPAPLGFSLTEGWLDEWVHSDYSSAGTPYVHAFGIEPAFLCRDLLVSGAFIDGAEGSEYEVEAELELALTRRIGLVVEGGYAWLDPTDESRADGIGDIGVAARFLMVECETFLLSVNTGFEFPTGDEDRDLGAGETIFVPSIATWLDLGENFTLQNVVGLEHGFTSKDDVFYWGGALIWSLYTEGGGSGSGGGVRAHMPRGMLNLIAEIGGELAINGDDRGAGTGEWLFGVSYSVSSQMEIRAAISVPAWNPRAFENAVTLGLIYHF